MDFGKLEKNWPGLMWSSQVLELLLVWPYQGQNCCSQYKVFFSFLRLVPVLFKKVYFSLNSPAFDKRVMRSQKSENSTDNKWPNLI